MTGTVGFELASGNIYNVVLDHLSGRWWGNKPFLALSNDAGNVHDISYQWIMCYEPNAGHPVGPMADATSGSARNSVEHRLAPQLLRQHWPPLAVGGHWQHALGEQHRLQLGLLCGAYLGRREDGLHR